MGITIVAVISSSDLMRLALENLLISHSCRVAIYANIEQFRHSRFPAHFILLHNLSDNEALLKQQIAMLQLSSASVKVLVISSHCEPTFIWNLIQAGTSGILCLQDDLCQWIGIHLKNPQSSTLLLSPHAQSALGNVQYFQQLHLTDYQRQVLCLMRQCTSTQDIARHLNRSMGAIYQVQHLLRDLFEVSSNKELIAKIQAFSIV